MVRVRFIPSLVGALAVVLTLASTSPVLAQSAPPTGGGGSGPGIPDVLGIGGAPERIRNFDSAVAAANRESDRERAVRLRNETNAGKALAARAGVACPASEAVLIGKTDAGFDLYETACVSGPGYLITDTETPSVMGCVVANTAAARVAADPTAVPPATCTLPSNQNVAAAIVAYAQEAGVACQIDESRAIGQVGARAVYEIGCAGRDGYRITQTETGWSKITCLAIVNGGSNCAFTTQQEQNATLTAFLADTEARSCVVDGGRYMGSSANGTYYEAKCSGAEGYVFRVKDGVTEAFPCATAQGVGGGCRLTAVAAAPPAAE